MHFISYPLIPRFALTPRTRVNVDFISLQKLDGRKVSPSHHTRRHSHLPVAPTQTDRARTAMVFISGTVFSALLATVIASPALNLAPDRCRYKWGAYSIKRFTRVDFETIAADDDAGAREDWDSLFGGMPQGIFCVPAWTSENAWWCLSGHCEPVVCHQAEGGEYTTSYDWWGRCLDKPPTDERCVCVAGLENC